MIIGVPKEIKTHEYRIGLTPDSVKTLTGKGHTVLVESGAGAGIGAGDTAYTDAGAGIAPDAATVFEKSGMIVKVKEPQKPEWERLGPGQILFTYLHLAADPAQTEGLKKSGCTAIAYETITDDNGRLPLLAPMSAIAGRLSVMEGAYHLKRSAGGRGILIAGVPGMPPAADVPPGDVVIIGGGVVGTHAAQMAVGLGANVVILDRSAARLKELDAMFSSSSDKVATRQSDDTVIAEEIARADLVIGGVLIPGGAAPKLVRKSHLATMRPGAVICDVAIDQGGCFETSRPTTHDDPVYEIDGVVHYCVANMPGAVPLTASRALNNATLPFVMALAENGLAALEADPHLARGVNIRDGELLIEL